MSRLAIALSNLGFNGTVLYDAEGNIIREVSAQEQHKAIIENFYFAGFFDRDKLGVDITRLDQASGVQGGKLRVIAHIANCIADGLQEDGLLDLDYVYSNLFSDDSMVGSVADIEDYILYCGQTAFDRNFMQERNELHQQDWMSVYKDQYLANAKLLGMYNNIPPKKTEYAETWIMGAARLRTTTRVQDLSNLITRDKIAEVGSRIRLLAGNRELWAEIDGIGDNADAKREEGKAYMLALANKLGIRLNETEPFIRYDENTDTPTGRKVKGRTYLNYAEDENRVVTEALMAEDICKSVLDNIEVVNTESVEDGHYRPTTITTAQDAVNDLSDKLCAVGKQEADILIVTNQPYVERMTIPIQRMMDAKGPEGLTITADGIGSESEVDVAPTHSEFGALCAEKYKAMVFGKERPRPAEALMFQNRDRFFTALETEKTL